ncbi:MAG TPA: hypothetical protein VF862_00885 [Gemmatimonadales bacterium]
MIEVYRSRLAFWREQYALLDRRYNLISAGRAALFVAVVVLVWVAAARGQLSPGWALLPAGGFALLALLHERVAAGRDRARRGEEYFLRGLERLDGTWAGKGDAGERFRERASLYADDLDLFGRGGLFELLCTCRTTVGQAMLAEWLLRPADPGMVQARQAAVLELRDNLALREDLAITGAAIGERLDRAALVRWAAGGPAPLPGWIAPAAFALGVANVATLVGAIWFGLPPIVFLLSVLAGTAVALAFRGATGAVVASVDRAARQLDLVAQLVERLERERPASPHLATLIGRLRRGGGSAHSHSSPLGSDRTASREIARLDRLVGLLDSRRNQLFMPVAALLLWTTQLAAAVERWRRRAGGDVVAWVDAVAEVEALAALATFAFERPDCVMPQVVAGPARFEAEGLAHPLLPGEGAVANDVALGAACQLYVVSGSNMSGKSTLLRAVGVNAVLAQSGAPVRATRLTMSALAIGASFRAADSLLDGQSRFYAEIARLRQVVDLLDGPVPLVFLLDELLSGTNSHDRAIGASAVVRHLVERGAIGLVTTHDLALAAIAEGLGTRAANVHFEDHLEQGQLRFDYRLKPGVVTRSNALELMRSVGLAV